MTQAIHLTEAQADQVRSELLDPMPYWKGGYVLGLEVLTDPTHAEHHAFLETLPVIEFEPEPGE